MSHLLVLRWDEANGAVCGAPKSRRSSGSSRSLSCTVLRTREKHRTATAHCLLQAQEICRLGQCSGTTPELAGAVAGRPGLRWVRLRAGRLQAAVPVEPHDPSSRVQLAVCGRSPALSERDAPDRPAERVGDGRAHTGQRAPRRAGVGDSAADRKLIDEGKFLKAGIQLSCFRNRSNLPPRDPHVAHVRVIPGAQSHVGIAPARTPSVWLTSSLT